MKKAIVALLISLVLVFPLSAQVEEDTLFLTVNASIMVFDRAQAAEHLVEWCENTGGYFTTMSEDYVRLRVPDENLADFKPFLRSLSHALLSFDQQTMDLRQSLLQYRSALQAREEVLERNLEYLNSSNIEGTLALEQEVRRLRTDIDQYRGYLRKLENDRVYAEVSVQIAFRNRSIPLGRPSAFPWINDIDFQAFMNDPMQPESGIGGPRVSLPEGYAQIDQSPILRAMSPEGARFRVRSVKNYPSQELTFWTEALFHHLSQRGFVSIMDEPADMVFGDGESFVTQSWAVPLGTEDYVYTTGIRLVGNKIEILEIAGEASVIANRLR